MVSFAHTPLRFIPELSYKQKLLTGMCTVHIMSGLIIHNKMYDNHTRHYKEALSMAKSNDYANLINSEGRNTSI